MRTGPSGSGRRFGKLSHGDLEFPGIICYSSSMLKPLNRKNVPGLPVYPKRMLQFGEGNFLRAFVDWMVDRMNKTAGFNTGVAVVQPIENGTVDILSGQDGLYHLYLQGMKDGEAVSESAMIDAVQEAINPYSDYDAYTARIEDPDLRFIVSNTTEAGIAFDPDDKADMAPQRSFPGKMTALLHRRYETFHGAPDKGLIILACELIERNGDALKALVLKYADLWGFEPAFKDWLDRSCAFCSTLVDRIVPGFPRDNIEGIQAELGFADNLVVMGEYFHVWVIEAPDWVQQELPFEKAGLNVIFTDDMTAYRERKVRILNGAHTGTFAVAYLSGIDTVKEAYEDGLVGSYMRELVYREICPTLDLPRDELQAFAEKILERFQNPYIQHQWLSISLNAMSKWQTRVQPTLVEFLKRTGKLPECAVFSLAALMAFYRGVRNGTPYPVNDSDDILALYAKAWEGFDGTMASTRKVAEAVLGYEHNFKADLNEIPGLTDGVTAHLHKIVSSGMAGALSEMMALLQGGT